jgi:hypothetical protein
MSLKEELDHHDYVAEMRLMRADFSGSFLVVEGDTDCKVLDRFLDNESCDIVVVRGRNNVVQVTEQAIDDGIFGVLGLIDADFEEAGEEGDEIIVLDYHDLEMMILHTSAFGSFLAETAVNSKLEKFEKDKGKSVLEIVLDCCFPIACLRFVNDRHRLYLKFKGLKFENFFDIKSLVVDEKALLDCVLKNTPRSVNKQDLEKKLSVVRRQSRDLATFCNGHDATQVISLGLRECFASLVFRNGSPDPRASQAEIQKDLRLAFGRDEFVESGLFDKICRWQEANPPYTILRKV